MTRKFSLRLTICIRLPVGISPEKKPIKSNLAWQPGFARIITRRIPAQIHKHASEHEIDYNRGGPLATSSHVHTLFKSVTLFARDSIIYVIQEFWWFSLFPSAART